MVLVRQNSTGTRDHNPSKMQGKRDNFTSGVCFPHVEIDPRTSLCSRREKVEASEVEGEAVGFGRMHRHPWVKGTRPPPRPEAADKHRSAIKPSAHGAGGWSKINPKKNMYIRNSKAGRSCSVFFSKLSLSLNHIPKSTKIRSPR